MLVLLRIVPIHFGCVNIGRTVGVGFIEYTENRKDDLFDSKNWFPFLRKRFLLIGNIYLCFV